MIVLKLKHLERCRALGAKAETFCGGCDCNMLLLKASVLRLFLEGAARAPLADQKWSRNAARE
jgi:hypothetical protein